MGENKTDLNEYTMKKATRDSLSLSLSFYEGEIYTYIIW